MTRVCLACVWIGWCRPESPTPTATRLLDDVHMACARTLRTWDLLCPDVRY